jgi:DNA adenine methylase
LFFLLRPSEATLSDACSDLIDTYKAIKSDPDGVVRHLKRFDALDEGRYYAVRDTRSSRPLERAAEFIFLNRAAWNGLYRVNSRGEFNVPYGAPATSVVVDEANLQSCATSLRRRSVAVRRGDFAAVLRDCRAGDFVFLDPPYVTGHDNNGFIDYNERLFSWADQVRLAEVARELAAKGVSVIVTNANHDGVLALYDGFHITAIKRSSTLAGDKTARRTVSETVIRSFR